MARAAFSPEIRRVLTKNPGLGHLDPREVQALLHEAHGAITSLLEDGAFGEKFNTAVLAAAAAAQADPQRARYIARRWALT
jgi:hypothetical protein